MGLFDSRARAERAELKKHKRRQKSVREATKRDLEIGQLQDKTRLAKARVEYRKAKREERSSRFPKVTISTSKIRKKKQGKRLGKGKIRII